MKTRAFNTDQIGGIVLIASTVIMFAGAAIANLTLAQSQMGFGGEPEQLLAAIAAHPFAWRLADILILAAIILTAVGLVPITPGFGEPGRSWARAGLLVFSISAVLGATRRIVSIYLEPWVAVEGIELNNITVEAFSRFGEGLGEWFTILAFIAVALYGMAFLYRTATNATGWLFILGGVVGLILHLVGAGIPAFIFLETGALGVAILLRARLSYSTKG
ncbi:MAG: hypothetical protein P8Z00_10875 [Anaerolineales bacterium]